MNDFLSELRSRFVWTLRRIDRRSGVSKFAGTTGITTNQGEPYDYLANSMGCRSATCRDEPRINVILLLTGFIGRPAQAANVAKVEGAGAVRLLQDININPTAPGALPTNRPIGLSSTQNAEAQRIVAQMKAEGYTDIRVNQQQTNALGSRVGVNRPDISGTSPAGQRVHYELDTASSGRGAGHEARIQANDPAAKVILKTVN